MLDSHGRGLDRNVISVPHYSAVGLDLRHTMPANARLRCNSVTLRVKAKWSLYRVAAQAEPVTGDVRLTLSGGQTVAGLPSNPRLLSAPGREAFRRGL